MNNKESVRPITNHGPPHKIKVLPTAKLFSRAIRNTVEHKSIASLFMGV